MEFLGVFFKMEPQAFRLFQALPHANRLHHARATAPHVSKRVASAVSSKKSTLLLRMRRSKVDVVRAQAAVGAVRSGATSYRAASEACSVSVSLTAKRLKGEVRMDASVGAATVLSLEEETFLEGTLI